MELDKDALISEKGVYDLSAEVYHSDPVAGGSLTSTGARKLLSPGSPAKFRYWLDHPNEGRTREMEFGQVVHTLLLGKGAEPAVIDAPNWRRQAAQEQACEARDAMRVPILADDYDVATRMVTRLREHPAASALLNMSAGQAELTLVWQDSSTGVWCRALLDFLHDSTTSGGIFPVVDYKTCTSAAPEKLPNLIYQMGYHQQIAWYMDAVRAVGHAGGLHGRPMRGYIIFQERTPPYELLVVQLDDVALGVGRTRNEDARRVYAECVASGVWPGYAEGAPLVRAGLPHWVEWEWRKENDQ